MGLLEKLKLPEDLKNLGIDELKEAAKEIRHLIIQIISENGGHLASSLGAVELALALHSIYQSPTDKIIWDVGHQAYAHKILTGRYSSFSTIRKFGGISGFLKREENPNDVFGAGHASTSIAAALGFAYARDKRDEKYNVIAVIGDGSMTGGMAFEAMNSAGHLKTDITVILNDNEMSISGNVGGLSQMLNRLITDQYYNTAKEEFTKFIQKYKSAEKMMEISKRVQEAVKGLILPGVFFEELGFRYIGPINGHDLTALIETLKKIKTFKGPVLLHIVTKKGKGYPFAEKDPEGFHGTPKFVIQTGARTAKSSIKSYTDIFGETLCSLAEKDKKIVAITAAMTSGTGLSDFAKKFPERFLDVGIAEEAAVTIAAGMACGGMRPVVAIYSTFLQRTIDQIIHDVALQKLPVIFAIDRAGLVGEDGQTHHGTFDLSYLRMIPNMVLMSPKDETELQSMMATALLYQKGPVAIRYPRGQGAGTPLQSYPFQKIEIGKAEMLNEGGDAIIFSIGHITNDALKAAEFLKENNNLSVSVANLRFAKPLDEEFILREVKKHKHIFSLETNSVIGGVGSGINELIALKIPECGKLCIPIGIPDTFIEHGSLQELHSLCGLSVMQIAAKIAGYCSAPAKIKDKLSAVKISG